MSALAKLARRVLLVAAVVTVSLSASACQEEHATTEEASPDARLLTHAVMDSTPTAEGLEYVRSVAQAHQRADDAGDRSAKVKALEDGLAIQAPANLGEAEILRLELAARLGETLLPDRAREARQVLAPMLSPDRSLPIDRASAQALGTLGDAALAEGDDALAAGSYARAIRMMNMLREELKP